MQGRAIDVRLPEVRIVGLARQAQPLGHRGVGYYRRSARPGAVRGTLMSGKSEELIKSLHRVVADLEALAHSAGEAAGEGGEEVGSQLRDALGRARSTDAYVRENPWVAIGVVALVAFVAGSLVGGRRGR